MIGFRGWQCDCKAGNRDCKVLRQNGLESRNGYGYWLECGDGGVGDGGGGVGDGGGSVCDGGGVCDDGGGGVCDGVGLGVRCGGEGGVVVEVFFLFCILQALVL